MDTLELQETFHNSLTKQPYFIALFLVLITACTSKTEQQTLDMSNTSLELVNGILSYQEEPYEGVLTAQYSEGHLKSKIYYKNGRKHGIEEQWHSNGILSIKRSYLDGVKVGIHKAWWETNTPKFVYQFNDQGEYHGSVKEWYPSGNVYKDFNYQNGKEQGKQRLWKINGKIKANYEVVQGERFGLIGLKKCYTVKINVTELQ